jgi:phosphopantetheinyl transferase (holo-ACP synthase)
MKRSTSESEIQNVHSEEKGNARRVNVAAKPYAGKEAMTKHS